MKHPARSIIIIMAFILLGRVPAIVGADATNWKAGLASAVITPKEPVMLAGYASRTEPFTGVLDDLHAKALALEDASGERALILTADLIGFSADVGDPIRKRIATETRVPRESILL